MKKEINLIPPVFLFFVAILLGDLFFAQDALASGNVTGFIYSENVGWISMNNSNTTGSTVNYGVNIDAATGVMSGYAYSENIDWISFNQADVRNCPDHPTDNSGALCVAKVDMQCLPNGTQCQVTGWARAVAACRDDLWNGLNCTGSGAGNRAGGWDGWIHLSGATYKVYIDPSTGDFHGWASGSNDLTTGVVGWISFNCANLGSCDANASCDINGDGKSEGGTGCPAAGTQIKNYKARVGVSFNQPPVAAIGCDVSQCTPGGSCAGSPWIAYRPTANPYPCLFKLVNNSTDPNGAGDIAKSEWYVKPQGAADSSYTKFSWGSGISNAIIQQTLTAGTYTIKLYVQDTGGQSSSVTQDITVRNDAHAGFMCTMDSPTDTNGNALPQTWHVCDTYVTQVAKGEKLYVKDDPSTGGDYSTPSDGATITSRAWGLNGTAQGGNDIAETLDITQASNIVTLTVTDSNGRQDTKTVSFNAMLLPKWKEISPVSMILDGVGRLLASAYSAFR